MAVCKDVFFFDFVVRLECTSGYAAARVEGCMVILTLVALVVDRYIFAQCYTAPS